VEKIHEQKSLVAGARPLSLSGREKENPSDRYVLGKDINLKCRARKLRGPALSKSLRNPTGGQEKKKKHSI